MISPTTASPPGALVHADYRKWDGSPHWQSVGTLLGVDKHGVWVGFPRGTHFERPGAAFDLERDSVSLFPAAGFTPAFNAGGGPEQICVYVDITTRPEWTRTEDGWRVSMIDLDLDVVQRVNGFIFVDDEDEFAEHQKQFGYPPNVTARAEADARAVFGALRDRKAPFDGAGWGWMDRLRAD